MKEGGSLLFEVLLKAEAKGVILLKLHDLVQSLPLDELPNSPAVGNLEQVRLEIVVSEAKVEELFWAVLHLLEFHLNHALGDLSDVVWLTHIICGDPEDLVVLQLVGVLLFEEADRQLFSHLRHEVTNYYQSQ